MRVGPRITHVRVRPLICIFATVSDYIMIKSPSLPLPFVFIPILNKQLRTLEIRKLAQNSVGRNRIINLTVSLCHQSRFQTMNLIEELNLSHLNPMLLFKSLAVPSVLWVYPNVVPQRGCMMVLLPFMQVMWTSVLSKAFFSNF